MADFDVIIVGAGIVGSAVACGLAQHPEGAALRIALLEANDKVIEATRSPFQGENVDPRVHSLTPSTQRHLESLGAWSSMVMQRVSPYREMAVWDADGTGAVAFDATDVGQPVMGHIVENAVTVSSLLQRVKQLPNIELLYPERVASVQQRAGVVSLQLESGAELTAGLLVAADGANSAVREHCGFQVREQSYGQTAIVATVKTREPHRLTAYQRFMSTGPLAFLPLQVIEGDAQFSSIVWSADTPMAEQLLALDDDAFKQRLEQALESRLGEIEQLSPRLSFPLIQRRAVEYVSDAVVLVGDAAHSIHPLAGQGVNLGIADARVLTEELLRSLSRGQGLADAAGLARYQRRRKGDNLIMMTAMDGFKRLFGEKALPVRWLRNEGMRRFDRLSLVKQQVMKQAMGL